MGECKIKLYLKMSQGKITIPANVRLMLGMKNNECVLLEVTSNKKIEITPLGTTVYPPTGEIV